MASELGINLILSVTSLAVGSLIMYVIMTKTRLWDWISKKVIKENKEMQKILNDPELLKAKLEERSPITIDGGEEVSYKIEETDGVKTLVEVRRPYDGKTCDLKGEEVSFCQVCDTITKSEKDKCLKCGKDKTAKPKDI